MMSIKQFIKSKIYSYFSTFNSEKKSEMFNLVRPYLLGAGFIQGVQGIYLSRDAKDFFIIRDAWTPELSQITMELSDLIRREFSPVNKLWWINGTLTDEKELPEDCEWIVEVKNY